MAGNDGAGARGKGVAWVAGATLNGSGQISGWGTPINFDLIKDTSAKSHDASSAAASTSTSYITGTTDRGVEFGIAKRDRAVYLTDGSVKAGGFSGGGGGGGGGKATISFSIFDVGKTMYNALLPLVGLPAFVCVSGGDLVASGEEFFKYIIGKLGALEVKTQGETILEMQLTFTGDEFGFVPGTTSPTLTGIAPWGEDSVTVAPGTLPTTTELGKMAKGEQVAK